MAGWQDTQRTVRLVFAQDIALEGDIGIHDVAGVEAQPYNCVIQWHASRICTPLTAAGIIN
jgi:hypothetical protein